MQTEKPTKQKNPQYIWAVLALMFIVIVYLLVQNRQLMGAEPAVEKIGEQQIKKTEQTQRKSTPNSLSDKSKKPSIKRILKDRKREVEDMTPEQTGLRMFEELKTVTGNDRELLNAITQRLVEEAAEQKALEQSLAESELTTDEFWDEIEQMRIETEEYAESLLEPLQFDRFREVRQSWAKGRIHPDRDSRE